MPEPRLVFSSIRLRNFKAIRDAELPLRPLTVLVGENSAGKSSVLQALCLVAQAARAQDAPGQFPLNGLEFNAGEFDDLLHKRSAEGVIAISLTSPPLPDADRRRRNAVAHGFPDAQVSPTTWTVHLANSVEPGVASIAGIEIRDETSGARLIVDPSGLDDTETNELLLRTRQATMLRYSPVLRRMSSAMSPAGLFSAQIHSGETVDAAVAEPLHSTNVVAVEKAFPVSAFDLVDDTDALVDRFLQQALQRFLARRGHGRGQREAVMEGWTVFRMRTPERETRSEGTNAEDYRQLVESIYPHLKMWLRVLDRAHSARFFSDFSWLTPELGSAIVENATLLHHELALMLEAERDPRPILGPVTLPMLDDAQVISDALFQLVHYLGPLRQDPEATYRPGHTGLVATLGRKGEYAVAQLHTNRNTFVLCPTDDGQDRMTLSQAVNYWLEKMDIASEAQTSYLGRPGIELSFVDPQTGDQRDPTAVGVGASQVLPVLVMCLLAKPGELVLIEQPELHLHPAPQQALGDFLLGIARSGRQLIVETHSEYLINRLRLRVVEDDTDETRQLTQIWYGQRTDGATEFTSLTPNAFGSFDDWPAGFFDQGPDEAAQIMRLAVKKRRANRDNDTPR